MTNGQCMEQHDHTAACFRKCFSWSAVIAGAFVGIGLAFLLNLFSVAIGLSLVTTKEGMMTLAVGGFLGLAIGTIVSMFVAGYAAGYLGRSYCVKRNLGALYGFVAWCVALILTVMLAANMTRYVSSYSDFVSHSATVVVSTEKPAAMKATVKQSATMKNNSTETQNTMNGLGKFSLLVFALFFIGAVSSCFGGHCGMVGCGKNKDQCSMK